MVHHGVSLVFRGLQVISCELLKIFAVLFLLTKLFLD